MTPPTTPAPTNAAMTAARTAQCLAQGTRMKYSVKRPMGGNVWVTVTQHRTLVGAMRSLRRQQSGSAAQNGYCQDQVFIGEQYVRLWP